MARLNGNLVTIATSLLLTRGTVPGVAITAAGGLNGVGKGTLLYDGDGNLSWRPPGGTAGSAVDVSAGGAFFLLGNDPDKWLAVSVTAASLPGAWCHMPVVLADVFNNGVASIDRGVSDGTVTWSLTLTAADNLSDLTAWLYAGLPENRELSIRWDGVGAYVQPWNEADAMTAFGLQAFAAGTATLDFQRVIAGAASPRNHVRGWLSWDDNDGGRALWEFRGCYRLYNAAGSYQVFESSGADPDTVHDTPYDSAASLPFTAAGARPDADDYRLALTRTNRYGLRSAPRYVVRKRVVAGAEATLQPTGPSDVQIKPLAGGLVRVLARYLRPVRSAEQADEFALWYTTDGSVPTATGDPDITQTINWGGPGGMGLCDIRSIPAQANGVTLKVLLTTRKSGVVSATQTVKSHAIDTVGPTAPIDGEVVRW